MNLTELLSEFSSATRLYDLRFKNDIPHLGAGGLLVEAFAAIDALHTVGMRDIIVLSTNAHIKLKTLLGQPATLHITLSDGSRTPFSGLINQAAMLGSEGGLARYRLRMVPWTWLLSQSRTSRVWQDKTIIEIVDAVFARYHPHAAWTWSDETGPFLQPARTRSYCTQYRETDLAFITRLLAEEGISYRTEEHSDSPNGHRIVLFSDSTQDCAVPEDPTSQSSLGGQGIRYHGARSREEQDSISALSVTRTLSTASTTVSSYDYKTKKIIAASMPTRHPIGGKHAPYLESYDHAGIDTYANAAQAERYARLQMEAIEARNERWQGRSTVRTLRPGTRFTLRQGPLQKMGKADPDYVVFNVVSLGINNLPKPAQQSLAELFGTLPELLEECMQQQQEEAQAQCDLQDSSSAQSAYNNPYDDNAPYEHDAPFGFAALQQQEARLAWNALIEHATTLGYANRFDAIARATPWRPVTVDGHGLVMHPKPTARGSQTAIVVNAQGHSTPNGADEIHCDRLGRIRIRFHWQGRHDDAAATCWVRVAQRWASGGMGSQFLPRIGQEVLVQFMDNDIDRPIVLSALYNGQGEGGTAPTPGGQSTRQADISVFDSATDHRIAGQGNIAGGHSPVWHGAAGASQRNMAAQWGIRSKELGGTGYNQLLFDDTDSQGRIQLKSTYAATSLDLGHLIHSADNYRGSFRGLGAELRTDAYGALRAGQGLLLTTYGIPHQAQRRTPAGDNAPGMAHLKQAVQLADSFSQAATTHQTVAFASHLGSSNSNASQIDDDAAPLKALLKAASGMLDGKSIEQAKDDAANKATKPNEGTLPHTTDPIISIAAKAGLGIVAGQSIQLANGETTTIMSGQDSQFITGGQMRVHTGQAIGMLAGAVNAGENNIGLQLIAAQDKIEVQAQSDEIRIQARDEIDIISSHAHIDWAAAKKISLSTAGGANITIEGGNITVQCPGKITVHAGKKSFNGPTRLDYSLPTLPTSTPVCIECLLKALKSGAPVAVV